MDIEKYKMHFYGEIKKQLFFAKFSLENILSDTELMLNGEQINQDKFWYFVQGLLVSLANISKILYPVKKFYRKRGDFLKKELNLNVNSIFKNREIRNCFEHYDEHIEDFLGKLTQEGSIFVDSNMVQINIQGVRMPVVHMRNYLLTTKTLTFKDISLNLDVVKKDLGMLSGKIDNLSN